ncbi:cisplatin damage response ATP-dependent DNA ligase [Rhodospirillum sp. A1_3_36]|uniref:cisplatin damage response ATP-dependent DNA ligase n=1 Tax=Rhodospirillum sp. A1_3_36 TaxID=3391666 RepID=UPI0039A537EC
MKAFATLLDRLSTTPGQDAKEALIGRYLDTTPDPDRGWGLAVLSGDLDLPRLKAGTAKALILERMDAQLFALSYDYVGDLAETVALLWPDAEALPPPPSLTDVVETPRLHPRERIPTVLAGWLDGLDATGRWALLKLMTGSLRVCVSAQVARTAFARWAGLDLAAVEERWFSQKPPYPALFAWAAGGVAPDVTGQTVFRPFMLAQPLEEADRANLTLSDYAAEWKWDGLRVQLVCAGRETRLFSQGGEEITAQFPDVVRPIDFQGVLDGQLLVLTPEGEPAPFTDLQKRLTRKTVSKATMGKAPAHMRLYDMLVDGPEDLRPLPFRLRRARLEDWYGRSPHPHLDLSPLVELADWAALDHLRAEARTAGANGLMLKRWESPYVGAQAKGGWISAKPDPLSAQCVLMYVHQGQGGPGLGGQPTAPFALTFGVWKGADLVPLGKATPRFKEEETKRLTQWIREHARERFGPVRVVAPSLVLEVTFDRVYPSPRHKAGLALRFPLIKRIGWHKPAAEADQLETLADLV